MKNYDNSMIRRRDRVLDATRADELLYCGEYGYLSFAGDSGYGIPISFAYEGENIYFHCAPEGEKLRRTEANNQVSFCVVGNTNVQPASFSTEYESVIVFGKLSLVNDNAEKMNALGLIVAKYSPEHIETGHKYAAQSFHRTAVLKLSIEHISGKCKKTPQ